MDLPIGRLNPILAGTEPISIEIARRLSNTLGGTVGFWIARDGQYREDLARVEADRWAQTLPVNDMAEYGWIDKPADWTDRIEVALRFFDVPDLNAWNAAYLSPVRAALLRASFGEPPRDGSLAVWLRQAEKQARQLVCQQWDRERFEQSLQIARSLTRLKDPGQFIPRLQTLCASAGVAVVVVRAPDGCNVSGAARFLADGLGLIALTARYLTDDHLWFTFFHEAAHLVLEGGSTTYVDELAPGLASDIRGQEKAANQFATRYLLSEEGLKSLAALRPRMREIIKLAHRLGVAPGIIVGQLQFRGRLSFGSGMNHLKRRYQWAGISLETRRT
jgi:hypothetical protein